MGISGPPVPLVCVENENIFLNGETLFTIENIPHFFYLGAQAGAISLPATHESFVPELGWIQEPKQVTHAMIIGSVIAVWMEVPTILLTSWMESSSTVKCDMDFVLWY